MKNTKQHKYVKKHIKPKETRPKANVSSHNVCRVGYPFFLSPNDDDAMLEIRNPTPLSTRLHIVFCAPQYTSGRRRGKAIARPIMRASDQIFELARPAAREVKKLCVQNRAVAIPDACLRRITIPDPCLRRAVLESNTNP